MTTKVFRRVGLRKVASFAVAAIGFSLIMGVANAGQPVQTGGDAYNYTRGGGG